jgi:hypothetical protein
MRLKRHTATANLNKIFMTWEESHFRISGVRLSVFNIKHKVLIQRKWVFDENDLSKI